MFIYKIYNTLTDDIYVGSTILDIRTRFSLHKSSVKQGRIHGRLHRLIHSIGFKVFRVALLDIATSLSEMRTLEGHYIKKLCPSLNTYVAGRTAKERNYIWSCELCNKTCSVSNRSNHIKTLRHQEALMKSLGL